MKIARNRLGNLLSGIRKGDIQAGQQDKRDQYRQDDDDDRRGPGRPKRQKREKRVVFELRGKPFGLRDSGRPESIYALCRKWMYGRDDDHDRDEEVPDYPLTVEHSLDLLATKEIYALPPPRYDVALMDPRPSRVVRPETELNVENASADDILKEYKQHWRNVRKEWTNYTKRREERYSRSIQLLSTIYGITQQTTESAE
uniref:Uncharacterized protein n=1 Tax=Acrobeloides nanus TaxID=290746 RepID=A0A914E154_9BILA